MEWPAHLPLVGGGGVSLGNVATSTSTSRCWKSQHFGTSQRWPQCRDIDLSDFLQLSGTLRCWPERRDVTLFL